MLGNFEQFRSMGGKRRILVVDDESVNREILGMILQDDYEVLYACDGAEALEIIRDKKQTLSLVLLDILMPVMTGIEVLKTIKSEQEISRIPVIVLTADQQAEVECLNLGATDFIPKPYPALDVVKARVLRTIELSEDRDTIRSTERDVLTGLYHKEYFYRYAGQYDQFHRKTAMDAIIIDINHFHMINERHGKAYGDEVLRRIADKLREIFGEAGGLVCRKEADTFMVYCPHREDYKELLAQVSAGLSGEDSIHNRIWLRMGIYSEADTNIDIERRFDRAKLAADTVQGSFTKTIAYYDKAMHDRELYAEQLIVDFHKALEANQFVVFYQPKFQVKDHTPVLSSAEALVRWMHPELGMVSPGVFIPLFEENGLIQELDHYVWREACRQMREWSDRLGRYLPVSVNVSRIDVYDPGLVSFLQSLIKEYGLSYSDLRLEVTESAYTQDSRQIVEVAERLRKIGFMIEMDDFGTGYSSLNMLSSLPIDALKLDMQFIRSAFREGGNTRMLELIIDIAEYLSVPVIAEGVETREQLESLKQMGCELVQGYYFSKPLPPSDFESYLTKTGETSDAENEPAVEEDTENSAEEEIVSEPEPEEETGRMSFFEQALRDQETAEEEESQKKLAGLVEEKMKGHHGLQLKTTSYFFVILALLVASALFVSDIAVNNGYRRMEQASSRYITAQFAASDMESGSDYLTDRVRCFVVTGDLNYLKDFFEEVNVTKRRDQALADLEELLEGSDSDAYQKLASAMDYSNELLEQEYLAMRLMLETGDYDRNEFPDVITAIRLGEEDLALTVEEKKEKARDLVFNNTYMHYKDHIRENVSLCTQDLIHTSSLELERASSRMALYINLQSFLTVLFLVIVLVIVLFINIQVRKPLTIMVERMRRQQNIIPNGAEELQFVSETYNMILSEIKTAQERLSHEASHDRLTGLLNRGAYEMMLQDVDKEHMALILIDVDYFKSVNDMYGHDVGDRVLKRVAEILKGSFRSVDVICRIGGDEFVVIMTRVDSGMRDIVYRKIQQANETLQHPKDDLPPVSLSVGVAFSDRENPKGDIFKDADTALYRVKEGGRCGCEIY